MTWREICERRILLNGIRLSGDKPEIKQGSLVRHLESQQVRVVSGVRDDHVHLSQVIKRDGETFYWGSPEDFRVIG